MKNRKRLLYLSALFLSVLPALADEVSDSLRALSERTLLDASIAAEQAAVEARSDTGAGLELRPSYSEDDSGLAVRLYLPSRWTQTKLREQLSLVAQSEELRVAALEWQELLAVYRDFCTYRMRMDQLNLLNCEIDTQLPDLPQIDLRVQQHQFSVVDRAKLYGQALDLLNAREKIKTELLAIQRRLYRLLGSTADLDALAQTARIATPSPLEVNTLLQLALAHRADYQRLEIEARALDAASAIARSKQGFRFKHLQTEYQIDQTGNGQDRWNISAAFTLPWGNRNPDLAAYQKQKQLTRSAMAFQRQAIAEQLQSLLKTSTALSQQIEQRNRLLAPLIAQLTADLHQLDPDSLDQLRDRMSLRERLLDSAMETTRILCERDLIAVELAEQLGTFGQSSGSSSRGTDTRR